MEKTGVPGNIAEPAHIPQPDWVIRVDFVEAAHFVQRAVRQFDPDPQFAVAILKLLIKDMLDYANQWSSSSHLESAVEELARVVGDRVSQEDAQSIAYDICRQATTLLEFQMALYEPDFTLQRYGGKYVYHFVGGTDGQTIISFWSKGSPPGAVSHG